MATTCEIAQFKDSKDNWYQAGSQAFYACKYFAAIEDTNYIRNLIAIGQAVTQVYFADKQHSIAVRTQDRLDNIATTDLARSGELFGQFQKGIATEDLQLADAKAQLANLPIPDYDAIKNRVLASVNSQFTRAKTKVMECYPPHCQSAACAEIAKLEMERAKTASAQIEAAWRKEHALYEMRKATLQAHLMQVLSFGRGGLGAATALMAGAQSAIEQSGRINPYRGYQKTFDNIAETGRAMSLQGATAFRGMAMNMGNMQAPRSIGDGVQMSQLSGQLTDSTLSDQNGSDIGMAYGQSPTGQTSDGTNGSNNMMNIDSNSPFAGLGNAA